MKVLVMNCGSSSLKYQLIDMENESVLANGICERIGADGSVLTHKPTGKDKYIVEQAMPDHGVAVQLVLDALQDKEHGVIESADEITAIGHRKPAEVRMSHGYILPVLHAELSVYLKQKAL